MKTLQPTAKGIAVAKAKWERAQLAAAANYLELGKAAETIDANVEELDGITIMKIKSRIREREDEIKEYALKARDEFLAVVGKDHPAVIGAK